MPRSVVIDETFNWTDEHRPMVMSEDRILYEAHVKGFSASNPDVAPELRGTYAGLASPTSRQYLKDLGVTSVSLLPVHHFTTEPALAERGTKNYWGYSSFGFFAPHAAYSSDTSPGGQVREFKEMVNALHADGIEVMLDVVYNHTCEGPASGPSLMFRGFGERDFYKMTPSGHYYDTTGCGNTFDLGKLANTQLVIDSLRYWVTEMHVDGFRFDLATTLIRTGENVDHQAPFLEALKGDDVLRHVALIAEPWDLGNDGYQVGGFPDPWLEWNDRYRDAMRTYWLTPPQHEISPAELGWRMTGSQDIYYQRSPLASVNFITAHDGFTLADLVAYNVKHNEANGEGNRDGSDRNLSWNHGVEGETDDPDIPKARTASVHAIMACLLTSIGTPMLTMGDECGRTQQGNNNAYCQDNALSWMDWSILRDNPTLELTKALISLRRDTPALRRTHFFDGKPDDDQTSTDVLWLRPDGSMMTSDDFNSLATSVVVMAISGRPTEDTSITTDGAVIIALNRSADEEELTITPEGSYGVVISTNSMTDVGAQVTEKITLPPRSVIVLRKAAALAD
jgi:glycogen operon protein